MPESVEIRFWVESVRRLPDRESVQAIHVFNEDAPETDFCTGHAGGYFEISVTNPAMFGWFQQGQRYVFTVTPDPDATSD